MRIERVSEVLNSFKVVMLFLMFLLILSFSASSQDCDHIIEGKVIDASTRQPIAYANIYVKEVKRGAVSDSIGQFRISALCNGGIHLSVSHIGCDTEEIFIRLSKDTVLTVVLDHNHQLLQEVIVSGVLQKTSTQAMESLSERDISIKSSQPLATLLKDIAGVTTISNGGISKPVVHGLYGNRVLIMNNGIPQSGQQWGADHGPEIDPLVANSIRVIKGVNALEYLGSSLGAVILVEPRRIEIDPHLHGKMRYFFESNGRGNGINLQLQQASQGFSWRVNGSAKKSGDQHTADYFLNNTGRQEANMAVQLEKKWSKTLFSDVFLSTYNAEFGLLRGSQIGNLTDLSLALEREEPFYTEDDFSYSIDAPSQSVNHHLIKWHNRYVPDDRHSLDFTYAGQLNLRKEFDVRRAGRSDIPSLSLEQTSHFTEIKHQWRHDEHLVLRSGLQYIRVANTNNPETGILPLIPDYNANRYGAFSSISYSRDRLSFQVGARYDLEYRNVAAISISLPRQIIRYSDVYSNLSASSGVTYALKERMELSYNIGLASRTPEVNELYSNGLHQGVSGIEEGDPGLSGELSLKQTLELTGESGSHFSYGTMVYLQSIRNYIFLNPQDEIRLTIRGAFPVFKYEQTDASLLGADLVFGYSFNEKWSIQSKYSYLRGQDIENDVPLIYMPANRVKFSATFRLPKLGSFSDLAVTVEDRYVFEQKRILDSQDFTSPPKGYNLLGVELRTTRRLDRYRLDMYLRGENMLNVAYRDYLNRLRYFSDDLGLNITLGLNLSF